MVAVLVLLFFFGLAAALTLALPPAAARWVAVIGVALAGGEWYLAYRRSEGRDEAREGLELFLFTGLFALAFLALWLLGVAAAMWWRGRRSRTAP